MIPKGWSLQELGNDIRLISGQHINAADYSNTPPGIPYLTGPADFPNGKIIVSKYTHKPRVMCEPLDILLTVKGSGTGKIIQVDQAYCISRQLMAIRPQNWNKQYVRYFLERYNHRYEQAAAGLIPGITRDDVLQTPILVPPDIEQRKIAEILSTWDEAIRLTQALIAGKQQRKKGLMQRLLTGQVRFPGFAEQPWRKVKISKVADLTAGGTPSTHEPTYWETGTTPWMRSGEVHFKRVYEVEGRITQEGLDSSSTKLVPIDSVLIALAGQGKTRGTVAINKIELCTNQSVAAIMPDPSKAYYEYLFYNLDHRYEEIRRLSTGDGGRGGLNLKIIRNIEVKLPCVKEQRRIAAILQTCDYEIQLLQQKLAALQQQKKGLMQRLLTGELRVVLPVPGKGQTAPK